MTVAGAPRWLSSPSGPLPVSLGAQRLTLGPPPQYPNAMVNATNHCNLRCEHCFVFRDGNPNSPEGEMPEDRMLRELMRPATSKLVTDHCSLLETTLPLSIEGDHFTTPFCCYGNHVDCDRCGSWGVFSNAARMPGPWDAVLPPESTR